MTNTLMIQLLMTPDDDIDDEEYYDRVDQAEVDELLADESNPTIVIETVDENDDDDEENENENVPDKAAEARDDGARRSTRTLREPERLHVTSTRGQTYAQKQPRIGKLISKLKKVMFADEHDKDLEYCHNIIL